MNLDAYLSKHRDAGSPGVDMLMAAAPWLTRDRAAHWNGAIAEHVRGGTYTAQRQWSIAEAIVRERDE